MHGAITRYYYEETDDFSSYVGSILSFVVLFNLVTIPLLYLVRNFISDSFNIPVNIFVLAIIASAFALIGDEFLLDIVCKDSDLS